MAPYALAAATLLSLVAAQSLGTNPEVHPKLTTYKCTKNGGCKSQQTAIVLDSESHWIHQKNDTTKGCGSWGSKPDAIACPDETSCRNNCVMEGINDYADRGVITNGDKITLNMFKSDGTTSSPRVYLLSADEKKYEMMKLTGQEFTFTVDGSRLPCGMNSALYHVEMEAKGGQDALNPGGAAYGTGYCDAQCFVLTIETTPWLNGKGNVQGKGVCCNELDIWEANRAATQLAPHSCSKPGIYGCTGSECTSTGVCDKSGCSRNPYWTDKNFYKPAGGAKVDTSKPFTVVTQFPASNGKLQQVVRKYIQNGRIIEDANAAVPMDQAFCNASADYTRLGGHEAMGGAMSRGMVLAMSIWWSESDAMAWLDSGNSGPCKEGEGLPANIVKVEPKPTVTFSQIKWGDIGSTFKGTKHTRFERE